jgi:hypothetical protein
LELLPPSIPDAGSLDLLGNMLAVRPSAATTADLRLRTLASGFSWQALANLAESQGVIFPLIWSLDQRSLLLPLPKKALAAGSVEHPTAVFQEVYRQYLTRRSHQREQLCALVKALNAVGVTPLLLKGARYLLAPPRSWCEARDMRDLDILIHRDDAQKAIRSLEQIGYRLDGRFSPTDQHLPSLWLDDAPSSVELHIEALSYSARKILPTSDVWRHAIQASDDCGTYMSLPDEWQLLLGLLHHQVSDRGHVRRLLAVKALWEFASLGNTLPAAGWQAISDQMASANQSDVLGSFVEQASQLFGMDRPSSVVISPAARAHAEMAYRRAFWPYPVRRGFFLVDQFRHGFSREALSVRYGDSGAHMPLGAVGRHLAFLVSYHRGRLLRRITGRGDRLS